MQQAESEERCDCSKPSQTGPESATADLKECAQNQSHDDRLQHAEQEGHPPDSSVSGIEQTEPQEDGGRGKNKQGTSQESSYFSVQLPTNVDGELLRLRSRQQHAVTQCVEEMVGIDPATLLNQFGLHDREMSCCASEADPAQFPPESERFT